MNNVLNRITTRIIKQMETRLQWKNENLSERLSLDGKTIKSYFQDNTIDQILEYYGQAIRYNGRNLNIIKEIVCMTFFHIISIEEKLLQNFSSSEWSKFVIVGRELYIQEFFT